MHKLQTTNQHQLIFETNHLTIEVLGGIKLHKFDSLRVTLKITVNERHLRHNLDLYNHIQTEKLVRITAERLEIGTSIVRRNLEELTNELESYRLEQLANQVQEVETIELTDSEKKAALKLLKSKNLLEQTNKLIEQSGVIGEEQNRLVMYLIFTSRKTKNPLHCVSLGSSGAGKSHLQSKVAELIPNEDQIEITVLSENAFYYFERTELRNKLILIEDLDGAESVLYPLRELQSKRRITKTVVHKDRKGTTQTIHLTVEGPVSVAGCTTKEKIYEDNANRSFLLYIDESPEQDERIMNYQRKISAGKLNREAENQAKQLLQNTQRLLQPIKVINPYAESLKIPKEVFKPRRSNAHYLQFIEAVTFYHQHQREQKADEETGEIYIETTIEDIEQANQLLQAVLLRKSDQLTGACRDYFERLKDWLKEKGKTSFSNAEARRALRLPKTTHWRYHNQLISHYFITAQPKKKGQDQQYSITDEQEYSKLKETIENALNTGLQKIVSSIVPKRSRAKKKPTKQTASAS